MLCTVCSLHGLPFNMTVAFFSPFRYLCWITIESFFIFMLTYNFHRNFSCPKLSWPDELFGCPRQAGKRAAGGIPGPPPLNDSPDLLTHTPEWCPLLIIVFLQFEVSYCLIVSFFPAQCNHLYLISLLFKNNFLLSLNMSRLTEERCKRMNEIIKGMKVVKIFTWEFIFSELINSIRR